MRVGTVQKRNAFTLIELLVVIAIIVILMALTVGVLSKVYQQVDETKTIAEVSKLAESVNLFKGQFGRYPPSRIILAEQGATYTNIISSNGTTPPPPPGFTSQQWASLAAYSVEYLTSLFPGINLNAWQDWNGDNTQAPVNSYVLLEGEQCLVFFLGGMRYGGSAPQGFNTDKTNPTAQTSTARLGPFFPFDESRIDTVKVFGVFNSYNGPFYTYKDYYGTAYAYFLARYQGTNNYPNPYVPNNATIVPCDCAQLTNPPGGTVGFVPYFIGTVPPGPATLANWGTAANFQFFKADSFQIVSAGRDKLFGTGGQFNVNDPENSPFLPTVVVPAVTSDMLKANFDNITNFTGGRLVPQ